MNFFPYISVTIAILGALTILYTTRNLHFKRNQLKRLDVSPQTSSDQSSTGKWVLLTFLSISILFGAFSIHHFWDKIKAQQESIFFGVGLFLFMTFGMFVQVLRSNYQNQKKILDISATQLLYPLLFSVIVFYPIWVLGSSASDSAFAIYAAFLNGFFWETVVSNAQLPDVPE